MVMIVLQMMQVHLLKTVTAIVVGLLILTDVQIV
jgi:hypothetical protein